MTTRVGIMSTDTGTASKWWAATHAPHSAARVNPYTHVTRNNSHHAGSGVFDRGVLATLAGYLPLYLPPSFALCDNMLYNSKWQVAGWQGSWTNSKNAISLSGRGSPMVQKVVILAFAAPTQMCSSFYNLPPCHLPPCNLVTKFLIPGPPICHSTVDFGARPSDSTIRFGARLRSSQCSSTEVDP